VGGGIDSLRCTREVGCIIMIRKVAYVLAIVAITTILSNDDSLIEQVPVLRDLPLHKINTKINIMSTNSLSPTP
jgi:hypothetical protein